MTLLSADDRAYLSEETPQRYVFGDRGSPRLTLNAVDAYGVMWLCEEPQGWDSPEVDTPMDDRPHGHGGYAGESTFGPRPLTFTGSAAAPTPGEARRARDRLRSTVLSTLTGWIEYWHLDDDPPKALWLRPVGQPRITIADGRWLDYTFVMVAEDPIKHGDRVEYGPIRLRAGSEGGYRTPWRMPLRAAVVGEVAPPVLIANDGDEAAHALYRVPGPIAGPLITLGTGERIGLRLHLDELDELTVDTRAGTILVNGVSRYDAISPGTTLPLIPPGGTEAILSSLYGDDNQTTGLYVTTAPAWK